MSHNINNGNYIAFDLDTFKKTSKRLQHILCYSTEDEKIREHRIFQVSEFHEMLSKSLGFKNYDAIQKYFHKDGSLPTSKHGAFFESWSSKEIIELFSFFIEYNGKEGGKQWKGQALSLISIISTALKYMEEQQEILLDSYVFGEYFKLENIVKLYKTRKDLPSHIREGLRAYLMSIPGYEEYVVRQQNVVIDDHNYIYFNLLPIIEKIRDIEQFDPIIINPRWYHAVYSQNPSSDKQEEHKENFTIRLQQDNLQSIAKQFKHESWNYLFTPGAKRDGNQIDFINNKEVPIVFYGIELIHPIELDSFTEDTWLKDKLFNEILLGFIRNKNFKTYYLSDLLLYSFRIMNQQKHTLFMNFLGSLVKNYSSIKKYSERLEILGK